MQGWVSQQSLLLELLELLGAGEVEGVGPQVCPGVDKGGTQRFWKYHDQQGPELKLGQSYL